LILISLLSDLNIEPFQKADKNEQKPQSLFISIP